MHARARTPARQALQERRTSMVRVTRLNGSQVYVNAELIRFIEATPDTLISLVNGDRIVVQETPEAVVEAIIAYRRRVYGPLDATDLVALADGERTDGGAATDVTEG